MADNNFFRDKLLRRREAMETTFDSNTDHSFMDTFEQDSKLLEEEEEAKSIRNASIPLETNENVVQVDRNESKSSRLDKLRAKIRGKMLQSKLRTSNIDETLISNKEDERDDEEEEKVLEQKLLEQKLRRTNSNVVIMSTSEEAYDFFTSTWNEELVSPVKSPNFSFLKRQIVKIEEDKVSEEPGTSQESADRETKSGDEIERLSSKEESQEDKALLLVSDLLEMEDRWQLTGYAPAVYRPHRERVALEDEKLYIPSTTPVPIEQKIPGNRIPRKLSDEGFYVGRIPEVEPRNRNKMEQRFTKNNELQWFGEDGHILALPVPTDDVSFRPPFGECDEPHLALRYVKPLLVRKQDYPIHLTNADSSQACQLDVDVSQVVFSHHHLFSKEHILASRLTILCRQFHERRETSNIELLSKRLEVLRTSLANVREVLHATSNREEGDDAISHTHRLQSYRKEARLLRRQLDREERSDRSILKAAIRTWRNVTSLRERQGYSNTSVQLQITKKEMDKDADLIAWRREIDDELQEQWQDYEIFYHEKLKECRKRMIEIKESNATNIKHNRKNEMMNRSGNSSEDSESDDGADQDENGDEEELEPPKPFDEEAVRRTIHEKALQMRRRPGEPILYLELSNSNPLTPLDQCPDGEQRRRKDCSKHKVFVKVLYNDKEVSKTATKNLNHDFSVAFGEIFNLHVVQWPRSIVLQLFEVHGVSTSLMAEVYVPLQNAAKNEPESLLSSRVFEDLEFSSDHIVSHRHDGVGSGCQIDVQIDDLDDQTSSKTLTTSGVLRCRVSWGVGVDGSSLSPWTNDEVASQSLLLKREPSTLAGVSDPKMVKEWLKSSTFDPNDPSNAHLVQFLNTGLFTSVSAKDYFRLEQFQEEFNFVNSEDFFNGRRFQMIRLREEDVPEFRNIRMIPMRDEDIQLDVFKAYEKRIREERLPSEVDDDVDSYRRKCSNYLHKVREEVLKRYRYGKRPKELEDVVTEDKIPDIGSLGSKLIQWTEKTRPLRPIRKERKKVTAQGVSGTTVNVLINVANAFNVPVRKEAERAVKHGLVRQPTATSLVTINEPLVQPVVEVTFQHAKVRTSASSGPNPCWNHDLQLKFRAPDENYSPSNLQTVRDVIYFNLFDEVVVDILEDERDRDSHIHHRIEKRWLGSLQVPFSTLYLNTRIEGTFKVLCPPILLGYVRDYSSLQPSIYGSNPGVAGLEKDYTYLSIFVTLEPVLPLPEPIKEKFESIETEEFLLKAEQFRKSFESRFPKREVKMTVVYVNGKSVFVTRFLRELEPPRELLDTAVNRDSAMDVVARFVSLIPVVSDVIFFPGICDIWTTNEQFLSMLVGNQEEHAVLLCNYFLFMKKKAWLLLGFAVPDGPSVYVLTQDETNFVVWNACTGESFNVQDSFCPIQNVGCLINHENLWVNVQQVSQPSRMTFDIHNSKNWRPFFHHHFPNPGLSSLQPEKLTYTNTEPSFVEQLRDKIELALRNQIMVWRKRFRTTWNRHCGQVFRKILSKMEQSRIGTFNEEEIQSELHPITNVYKMCGFPLTMAYSEISSILEMVFATGVHLTEGSGVEFALSVHVHPYPHNVVAVWIYIASLHKRRAPDRWIVPGGGLEPNEEPGVAAIREVLEEAGVRGKLGRCLGIFEQNTERKHRTAVFVLVVTEELDEWEDSKSIGRKRKWFSIGDALDHLEAHKPVQWSYVKLLNHNDKSESDESTLLSEKPKVVSNGSTIGLKRFYL